VEILYRGKCIIGFGGWTPLGDRPDETEVALGFKATAYRVVGEWQIR